MTQLARLPKFETETPNTVLVVEDSASLREALVAHLSRLDAIRVETADSLEQAQELLAFGGERFACAVLDLDLSEAVNGEILELVRSQGIPVIMLNASIDERTRQQMHAGNIVDYAVRRNISDLEHVAYLVGRLRENHRIKVIVADESASFRGHVKWLLENYRYTAYTAASGREVLRLLKRHPDVSLVLTDFNLPVMNGADLIEAIRADHHRDQLSIIGMSDGKRPGVSAMMLKVGANDFLAKPFQVEEFYCRVTQNTNLIACLRELREAAIRDSLTGLYNRRHIFEMGSAFYSNACRGNVCMAVALVDADHLKHINDTHGHQVGDQALRAIANAIQKTLRTGDMMGRYGDEEIVCLTLIKRPQDAPIAFERVRRAVEAIQLRVDRVRVPLTASIGVTTDRCYSLEQMIRRADEGVQQAKEAGRNRVVCL